MKTVLRLFVLVSLLLTALGPAANWTPVFAQADAPQACQPLTETEQKELDGLAQQKADGKLGEQAYARLLELAERQDCAANANQLEAIGIQAVNGYTFASSAGTYTAITGGTVLGSGSSVDDNNYNNNPIGFSFSYNGSVYTAFSVNANGFLALGTSVSNSYNAISSGTSNNVLVALNKDLIGLSTGEIRYELQGTSPNQTLTVQWTDFKKYTSGTGDSFDFQIVLYETSNQIKFRYGTFTNGATSSTYQVGLRGASSADFFNRTTSTDWTASTAGGTNAATMTVSSTVMPPSGLTYTFTPPSGAPGCATLVSPADAGTNIAASASLNWSAGSGGTPTSYDVYFGTSTPPGFVVNQAGSPYDPGTMAYSTTYYWQIIPKNGDGDATGCSVWSFTTEADPTITPPWTEAFATYAPTNWTEANGQLAAPTTLTGSTSNWLADGFANVGTTGSARLNIYGTGLYAWMFTPPVNLGVGGNYQLEFDLALTPYGGTGSATLGADDKFAVVISTDGGATWTSANTLQLWNSSTPISNGAGDHITINLSSYTGVVKFGFYGESTVSNVDNDLFVDNVQVREIPAGPPDCANIGAPTDGATNVGINNDLSWSAAGSGGTPTSYDVYFGTSTPPGFVVNQAGSPYDPGTMAYSTTYYWQIIPKNADGAATGCPIWSFTTQADPTVTTFPYSQNFDGGVAAGWTYENTNSDSEYWYLSSSLRRGTTGYGAAVDYNGTLAMDDWLFTPPLQLTGGTTYAVRFFYRANGATYPESLAVDWGSAANSASMSGSPIFDHADFAHIIMKEAIATFTPGASGVYYIGFHGYSDADMYSLVLDDVTIYDSSDSIWNWSGATDTNWYVGSNWEGNIVPGELDTVNIPSAPANQPEMAATNSEASYGRVNNLTIENGASLALATNHNLKVEGTLTNNGTLQQTHFLGGSGTANFVRIVDVAGTTTKYYGVDITNTDGIAMGTTVVKVKGNQTTGCTTNPLDALLYRCYEITPTSNQQATIRYWFTEAERNGQDSSTLKLWHYDGPPASWTQVGDTYTYSEAAAICATGGGLACWFQGQNISTYSPFGLGSDVAPSAITLQAFGASQTNAAWFGLLFVFGMVIGGVLLVYRKRG